MKIQYMSDLHLEFEVRVHEKHHLPVPKKIGDVLVLAGDIHVGVKGADWINKCAEVFDHVLFVYGNHEFYNYDINETREDLPKLVSDNVVIMDNDVADIDGIRFIGTTLWSDALPEAFYAMNDSRIIYDGVGTDFSEYAQRPVTLNRIHDMWRENVAFIKDSFKKDKDTKNVVITHHAPSIEMCDIARYGKSDMNTGYATDLLEGDFAEVPDLWISGHTHAIMDKNINGVRCVSNCRGYAGYAPVLNFNPDACAEV